VNVNGIQASIVSVREAWPEQGGPTADVVFQGSWDLRYNLVKAIFGYASLNGSTIYRQTPYQYPPSPNLWARSLTSIEGIGPRTNQATGWLGYKICQIGVHFAVPPFGFNVESPQAQNDPSGQPWTTTKIKGSGEVFTPPGTGSTFSWNAAGKTYNNAPIPNSTIGVLFPRVEISMTRHWMPFIPVLTASTYIGSANLNPVEMGNQLFAKGTILFGGFNSSESADTLGNLVWEIEYTILVNQNDRDWNSYLAPDGTYQLVQPLPFQYLDFWANLP